MMSIHQENCVVCGGRFPSQSASMIRVCESTTCQQRYRIHLQRRGKICAVCGAIVQCTRADEFSICDSLTCKRQALSWHGTNEQFCAACGIHLAASQRAEGICAEPYCRQQLSITSAAQDQRRQQDKREHLEFLAMAQWVAMTSPTESTRSEVSNHPSSHTQSPLPIVVPANLRQLTKPPQERISILRQNLRKLATAVVSKTGDLDLCDHEHSSIRDMCERETVEGIEAERADSNFDVLANHACGTCFGFCCFAGREHAFLLESDVRRTMADRKLASIDAVADYFLSFIPEQTVEESCLFHGPAGCGMPRRMRSDMCNTSLCPSLVNLYHKSAGQAETQSYLFAATNLEDDLATEPRVFALQVASLNRTAE